jgi:serine/threonine-protein kinase
MIPEQARGLKTIDHRTDLYSLALVAYTMLTGNLAFSGDSFGDLLLKICTQELPSLQASAPWLPSTVDAWFRKGGAREPADRYQSAQEFADALAAAAGVAISQPGAPGVSQADQSAGYPQAKFNGSVAKPLPETRQVGAGSQGGGSITGATVQAATAHGGATVLPKSRAPMAIAAAVTAVVVLGGEGFFVLGRHGAPPPVAAASPGVETVQPVAVAVPEAPKEAPAAPAAPPVASAAPAASAAEPPQKAHEVARSPAANPGPASHSVTSVTGAARGEPSKPGAAKTSKQSSGAVDLGY